MGNNTFVFNLEWYAVLMEYPAEVRFEVYEAIMRYASSGTISELKPLAKMAFSFIKKEMDYNRERYENTVAKRREAGKKGGLQKAENNSKHQQSLANVANDSDAKQCLTNVANVANVADNDNVNDNVNDKEEKKRKDVCEFSELELQFEEFRKSYPGTKRGFEAEFDNFKRKNPRTWREIIPLLAPALERLIEWHERSRAAGQFTPNYKNLATWLNQQCWTEELPEIIENPITPQNNGTNNNGNTDRQSEFVRHVIDKLSTPDCPDPDLSDCY